MRNKLYHSAVVEGKNGIFYAAFLISMGLIILISAMLINLSFNERYQSVGFVQPSVVLNLGSEYGGLIKENGIIPGDYHAKGDILMTYNRDEEVAKRIYLQQKYDIFSSQKSRLKGNVGQLEIDAIDLRMNDIKHELKQLDKLIKTKTLIMPFDGLIVSGSLSNTQFNRVSAGDIVAKVVDSSNVVIAVKVPPQWVEKVKKENRVILVHKTKKIESTVQRMVSIESDGQVSVSALINVPESIKDIVSLGSSVRVTIYTEKISFKDMFLRAMNAM